MRVTLGRIACNGIESQWGPDIPAGARAGLGQYSRTLESGQVPIGIPRFCRDQPRPIPGLTFDVAIDADEQVALERAADQEGVTVDQFVRHAILVFLADLDCRQTAESSPGTRRQS